MLKALIELLSAPQTLSAETGAEHALRLAIGVLLVEIMRADNDIHDDERTTVSQALQETFALSDADVAQLLDSALEASNEAYDLHRFTSEINRQCDREQRIRIIEHLWKVVWADGSLSAHENHLMRRLADLLHVSHADYVTVKTRTKQTANAQPSQ